MDKLFVMTELGFYLFFYVFSVFHVCLLRDLK